jgi:3-isopropylmalate/(R)-2-methylmalate dehydratase small subunit
MSDEIRQIGGRAIPMPGDDIDTDRISPARFLMAITFEGMEKALFCDERENTPDHPIDNPAYKGAKMLFVGKNFGSGSSREHAPQAINRYGIEVIVGVSFAEIFAGNCLAIGVPTLMASVEDMNRLIAHTQQNPRTEYVADLENLTVSHGSETIQVEMLEERRQSFLRGIWNVVAILKSNLPRVREVAEKLPYITNFQARD